MRHTIRQLVESNKFQNAIIGLIVFNAILLGMETSPTIMHQYGQIFSALDAVILGIFCLEIVLRVVAHGRKFFVQPWSLFDLVIVGISLIPDSGAFSVLRSLRILRAMRLFSVIPSMRKVIGGLFKALPGIGSVSLIMLLVFYIYAVMGTKLFGAEFTEWFGTLGKTMYTLFQIMTLESWSMGIVRPVMEVFPYAWLFFVSYILCTTFTMLNLFIAVIINAMHTDEEKQAEESRNALKTAILEATKELEISLSTRLQRIEDTIQTKK